MMRQAPVSVAAAAFVVLSGAGQADKGALRSVQSRVMGVGATLLTAGPRAGTQCGCGTGAPQGMGRDLACIQPQKDKTDPTPEDRASLFYFRLCVCAYRTKAV